MWDWLRIRCLGGQKMCAPTSVTGWQSGWLVHSARSICPDVSSLPCDGATPFAYHFTTTKKWKRYAWTSWKSNSSWLRRTQPVLQTKSSNPLQARTSTSGRTNLSNHTMSFGTLWVDRKRGNRVPSRHDGTLPRSVSPTESLGISYRYTAEALMGEVPFRLCHKISHELKVVRCTTSGRVINVG